ncbi:MAG: DUF1566 domain-containing protein [Proteobacteria bacterium]|nr:DUF1566 domain-containing protein [Pseudomonadota bacterium]
MQDIFKFTLLFVLIALVSWACEDNSDDAAECDPLGNCCNTDGTECKFGCDGENCWPECNPTLVCCNEDGTNCKHGCDREGLVYSKGDCWPECNPTGEIQRDKENYHCVSGRCETDGECSPPMTDCTGGKYDPDNDLCWQDPPAESTMTWYVAAGFEDATHNPGPTPEDYCGDLGSGWRLPTISELRSLFRMGAEKGCEVLEFEMSWSSAPERYCEVLEGDCLESTCSEPDMEEPDRCAPSNCPTMLGSGVGPPDGCYWDGTLRGSCNDMYWSSSELANYAPAAWIAHFKYGRVNSSGKELYRYVRCVRSGP